MLRASLLGVVISLLWLETSCNNAGGGGGDGGGGGAPAPGGQPSQGDSTPPVVELTGAPEGESNITKLKVAVGGDDVTSYAYAIVAGEECSSLAKADFVAASTPITAEVDVDDGVVSLCVAGKDAAGNVQDSPTKATWTKDTVAPTAAVSDAPNAPTSLTTIAATVTGTDDDGLIEYAYATVAGDTCETLANASFRTIDKVIKADISSLDDGPVTLCVAGKDAAGNIQVPPTGITWTKDTVAPTVVIGFSGTAFGPGLTAGDSTELSGTSADATTSVVKIQVSIQMDDRSDGCLNEARSGFVADCPNWLDADGSTSWDFAVADDVFSHGHAYKLSARGYDKAANVSSGTSAGSAVWDTIAPDIAAADLSVTEQSAQLALSWTGLTGATGYLVVRKAGSAPSFEPAAGTVYTVDASVATDEVAAYVGNGTSFVDDGLVADTVYYYALFAYDDAANYSGAATGNGTARAAFLGISRVYVVGPGRTVGVDWQLVDDGVHDPADYVFSIYAAATSGGQSYTSAAATATDGRSSAAFTAPGNPTDSVFAVVRSAISGGATDANVVEHGGLSFASGVQHKLTGVPIHNGINASQAINPVAWTGSMTALALDRWGNQVYSAAYGAIAVRCQENLGAPYCRGRLTDSVYTVVGSDWIGDAADAAAPGAAVGAIRAVAVDRRGNIYFSDSYYRVRVQCNFIGTTGGFCAGKTPGLVYRLIGTGVIGYAIDGASAASSSMGYSYGLAVDAYGNVAVADGNGVVMALCYSSSGRMCVGKSIGTVNWLIGDASGTDGADGVEATAAGVGIPKGVAIDAFGNVYVADDLYGRVRVLCLAASGPACSGKATGKQYRIAGDGTTSDGDDGVAASTAIGDPFGIAVDGSGNLYLADSTYARTRVICLKTTGAGPYCNGATAGNVYRLSGIGSIVDGPDGDALDGGHGTILGIAADAGGNVFATDENYGRLRAFCYDVATSGYCAGKTYGAQYRMTAGWQAQATSIQTARPARGVSLTNMRGLALDSVGNVYVADTDGYYTYGIYAICYDVATNNTFCTGKTRGFLYRMLAGSTAPATTGTAFGSSRIIAPQALVVDPFNNVLVADEYNSSVYALCVTTSGGFCSGKTVGKAYRIAGRGLGTSTAPGDDVAATSADYDDVTAMAVDSFGNIFVAPSWTYRVWAVCVDTSTPSPNTNFCSGRTVGNTYYVAGDGNIGDGSDDVAATGGTGRMGYYAYGLDVDEYNNLFLADGYYQRLRGVCNNTVGGFCSGKTAGRSYRIAGVGGATISDGTSGATRNSGSDGLGSMRGIAVDPSGNIFVVGNSYTRVRVVCLNTTNGYCQGKTADAVYHWVGNGNSGDGMSNTVASTSLAVGSAPSGDTLAIDPTSGDIFYGDDTFAAIRWFKGY